MSLWRDARLELIKPSPNGVFVVELETTPVLKMGQERWVTVFFSTRGFVAGSVLSSTTGVEQDCLQGKVVGPGHTSNVLFTGFINAVNAVNNAVKALLVILFT